MEYYIVCSYSDNVIICFRMLLLLSLQCPVVAAAASVAVVAAAAAVVFDEVGTMVFINVVCTPLTKIRSQKLGNQ